VTGIFIQNWDETEETGVCTTDEDYRKVQDICRHLNIPCRRAQFIKEYWNEVFSPFLKDYEIGRTPNPDILCNRKIKFGVFLEHVKNLGFDLIATGHYAQLKNTRHGTQLLKSLDTQKDQTYFLARVPGKALMNTCFPLGQLTKTQVKNIATKIGLQWVAEQQESMGICFIGPRPLQSFLESYIEKKPGVIETTDRRVIGQHNGLFSYTIGQRIRLPGLQDKFYVISKDQLRNVVIAGIGNDHQALYNTQFDVEHMNWIAGKHPGPLTDHDTLQCKVRVRHGLALVDCTVQLGEPKDGQFIHVKACRPIRAITPGQAAVFYLGDECLGGGEISGLISKQLVSTV
jgi:tRNA-specific 2-thiouridylase